VLLALGPRWNPAVVAMEREVYGDPWVSDFINSKFVPVWVDADNRPDISDRYYLGGWPTTAFLTSDGRVLGGETFATAERLCDLLPRVVDAYSVQRKSIDAQPTPIETRTNVSLENGLDVEVDAWLANHLLEQFDKDHAGFGAGTKRVHRGAMEFSALRVRAGDLSFSPILKRTLRAIALGGLYDDVNGGVFHYCGRRDWTEPSTEKLLGVNATALSLFLECTDDVYLERASDLINYVRNTFVKRIDSHSGFYSSQQADAFYYQSQAVDYSESAPPPPVDRTVYSDRTSLMAKAYVRAASVFGDSSLLEFAVDVIEHVVANTYERGGGIGHQSDLKSGVRGLLVDQVFTSSALLDLYTATDRDVYLDMAQEIMHFSIHKLWDGEGGGGFRDRVPDPDDIGLLQEPVRPFMANCEAARVLSRLSHLTAETAFRERALATLAAVGPVARTHGVDAASYALALGEATNATET